jgi:hypothetical protein
MGLELQEGEQLKGEPSFYPSFPIFPIPTRMLTLYPDKRFNKTAANIVHMVIKREVPEDEEIKDSKKSRTDEEGGRRSSNCCGCVIL